MNKIQSKSLLSSVQAITKATRGQELTEDLINELKIYTDPLIHFYDVTHFQAIILSLFLEAGLRDRDIETDNLIDHFGKEMSVMADVNEVVDELLEKGILYTRRDEFSSRNKRSYQRKITAHDRVLNALVKGDKELLSIAKMKDFYGILGEVRDYIVQRIDCVISTDQLANQTMRILEANRTLPEAEWLLSLSNISSYDMCLLLDLTIEHIEGAEEVDLDKLIKEIFANIPDRIKYKRKIKEGNNPLFKQDIVVFSEELFSFMNYIRLSEFSMDNLLGGSKEILKKEYQPKLGTLIYPNKINEEQLFYNDEEYSQIGILKNALLKENYDEIVAKMRNKGMKPGFNVLLFGHPGTGKTASVMQIAKQTGRTIFMVEIQKIQSKWVGESEKNLSKVFAEYREVKKNADLDPILLFNEADAILGKRFDVQSSVDKSFNALQNILLQELEDFEGIFMATTNLADQLDSAFDRRFLWKVSYKKPSSVVRLKIMQNAFQEVEECTLSNITSKFELTGGQISNIKKKLLVESIMKQDIDVTQSIERLCYEECILNKKERNTIGFKN